MADIAILPSLSSDVASVLFLIAGAMTVAHGVRRIWKGEPLWWLWRLPSGERVRWHGLPVPPLSEVVVGFFNFCIALVLLIR
jgi:hypothetical protein